jgi:hypothetical protein
VSRTDDSRLSGILVSSQRGKRGVEKVRGTALIRRDESGILTQTLRGLMTRAQTFDSAGKSREVRRSVTPVVGGHFVEQVQYLFREAVKPGAGAFLLRLRANKHFFVDPRGKRLGELQPHEAEALRLNDR